MFDRHLHRARALLVEGNAMLRSVTAGQLRDLGVGHVRQVGRVKDARMRLETEHFDIVVCSREFEDSADAGQDLLDELRRENLLPRGTVFLMLMAEVTHRQVAEAAEASLDGFLIRPFTTSVLSARLTEARHRKRELAEILHALDAGRTEAALLRAQRRYQEQRPYAVYCGRLAAELMLTLQRHDDASRLFQRLAEHQPGATWARLGIARAQSAAGDAGAARKTVAEVLASEPGAADAHELMGRLRLERSDFAGALDAYRSAAAITPDCLLRGQMAGALAFCLGLADEALTGLERMLALGAQSRLFDPASLLLIAILRHDLGDDAGVAQMRDQLRRQCERQSERQPGAARVERLAQAASALCALNTAKADEAVQTLRALAADAGSPHFDLESATVLLAVWSRVPAAVRPAAEYEALVNRVAMRFCTAKAVGEVLVGAACRSEPALGLVRSCQALLSALTERAMDLALKGDAAAAVAMLLERGEASLNAKLLEMAAQIARRNAATLPDAEPLAARAGAALSLNCQPPGQIAGIRSARVPGGLQVPGRAAAPAAPLATAA